MLSTKLLESVGPSPQQIWQPSETPLSTALDVHKHGRLHLNSDYTGCFTLPGSPNSVSRYLDSHHEWFERCAHPMTVTSLGPSSYSLCPGRFKCLNFAVEPIVGIKLIPIADDVYQLQNSPLNHPTDESMYALDFCLSLQLSELHETASPAEVMTVINWELTVAIWAELPRVIRTMPKAIVRQAAMQLLNRIINQVTQRLTEKIKTDFTDRTPYARS